MQWDTGSIPGWGTKIPHAIGRGQKKKRKNTEVFTKESKVQKAISNSLGMNSRGSDLCLTTGPFYSCVLGGKLINRLALSSLVIK